MTSRLLVGCGALALSLLGPAAALTQDVTIDHK